MTCIGYIGLGLIGGSVARAVRRYLPEVRQVAYSHTPATLTAALDAGVIDEAFSQFDPRFGSCDYIFLCAPVHTNISYLPFLRETIRKGCVVTDVGSVKGEILQAANEAGLGDAFIGGHPMAGTEKTGFANSFVSLLENAFYFLTPAPQVPEAAVQRFAALIRAIRALPIVASPEEHDFIVAGVSHLPHILASALVNTVKDIDTPTERMKLVAAGGFRDITRIASSSPAMWQQICVANQEEVLRVLDHFTGRLATARALIAAGDEAGLSKMFQSSKDYRDAIDDTHIGSVPRQYILYVDIFDETGAIATITTMLALQQINIRNIGILHTREFEEGVLRIEFYEEAARDAAEKLLLHRNYKVRKKR